jgi:hypothetical protein
MESSFMDWQIRRENAMPEKMAGLRSSFITGL